MITEEVAEQQKEKTKFCNKCKRTLPITRFCNRTLKSGNISKRSACQDCDNKRTYYTYTKTEKGQIKLLLRKARGRAKEKGLEYNLTESDLNIPEYCPVLGWIKLERNTGGKKASPCSPSIDRMDNNKGYISGNVKVISYRANALKNDATVDEMERVLEYMRRCDGDRCEQQ